VSGLIVRRPFYPMVQEIRLRSALGNASLVGMVVGKSFDTFKPHDVVYEKWGTGFSSLLEFGSQARLALPMLRGLCGMCIGNAQCWSHNRQWRGARLTISAFNRKTFSKNP